MATYVLVHGAWCWQRVREALAADGSAVHVPTLTGLGERAQLVSREVGLETHVADVLTRVTMIGNDLELDAGIGTCGKEGQSVPVGVGQPTLKIEGLTVGGTG